MNDRFSSLRAGRDIVNSPIYENKRRRLFHLSLRKYVLFLNSVHASKITIASNRMLHML